jgi:hypothetical protein
VGAVLFWPALFALDTTDTEQVEINALQSRNAYLTTLQAQHQCGGPNAMDASAREPAINAGNSPPAAGTNTPRASEFIRCQLTNGSVAMLTQRECATWGGRTI